MATVNDIYAFLNALAPVRYQMDFDNAGFLVGDGGTAVKKTLLALDITDDVIAEAVELRLNLQFHFFQDDGILFSGAYFAAGTEFAAGLYQGRNTGRIGQWSAYADIGVLAHLDAGVLY